MIHYIPRALCLCLVWIEFVILTTILYLFSWIPFGRNIFSRIYRSIYRYWLIVFVKTVNIDLRIHQRYLKKIPKQYIVVANHPSLLDNIGLAQVFDVRYLAKAEVKNWPIFGRITTAAGTMYVDREDKASRKATYTLLSDVIKNKYSIGVYIEGGCKGKRIHLPFKAGAFETAIENKIPVIPVLINYEAQEDIAWGLNEGTIEKVYNIMTAKNNVAHYHIFEAVDPSEFNSATELREYMQDLYLKWQDKYLI